MYDDIRDIVRDFETLPQVEAFAVGGSRATGKADARSDYDVYLYVTEPVGLDAREAILLKYCNAMEIGNHYWENEDNCTLKNGIDIDLIYRGLDEFARGIAAVVDECRSANGYTTCMWHNLLTCDIVFDKNGRLSALKERYTVPYPEQLKRNIITRNLNLLSGVLPSYDLQIKKAAARGDLVSVNHRTAEFLASYFDVIFALNEMAHPGAKRLAALCTAQCKVLPAGFEENLNALFHSMFEGDELNRAVKTLVLELEKAAGPYRL